MRGLNLGLGLNKNTPSAGSSPFLPSDVTSATFVSWHDMSDLSTISSTGSLTDSINDKSGNSYTATATGSQRPDTETRTQNSLNVLDFAGSESLATGAFSSTLTQPTTIIALGAFDSASATNYLVDGIGGSNRNLILNNGSSFKWGAPTFGTFGASDTDFHLFYCTYNGASSFMSVDGVSDVTFDVGSGVLTGVTIGASNTRGAFGSHNGSIGEVIVYEGLLSSGDRSALTSSLLTKWGIS
jgi:hypothetical protein